ncbi:MAG: family 43 glycosylhydrolase [Akkermansiaceae bacterium]|nr:family 43 glycosylhydrolase [Armatimonadota bacterium]
MKPILTPRHSGNPVFPGWYADPEIHCFAGRYYIYPTTSRPFAEQTSYECWSSDDLTDWRNEGVILDFRDVPWSTNYAAWAPSCAERNGKYYLYFSAGDGAGIGVAASDTPTGPFRDAIGIPLVSGYPHGAQAIDAHCFVDDDGKAYLYFGGHGVCVVAPLTPTMCAFNRAFRDITPSPGYVEGPFMIKRRGKYHLMWSEGGWTDHSYLAAYGVSDSPYGPFEYGGKILENNPEVANGAGHHSVLKLPGTDDDWVICYHRRPLTETNGNHRVVCVDRLRFREDGTIAPVTLTNEGVPAHLATR